MRLIKLQLGGFQEEADLTIRFERQHESDPALAFLVGANGSGKSRVMESLGRIFSHLSAGVPPGLDFEIEYELYSERVLITTRAERVADLGEPPSIAGVSAWLLSAEAASFSEWESRHLHDSWPTYLDKILPARVVGLSSGPASRLEWAVRDSVASTLAQSLPGGLQPLGPTGSSGSSPEQRDSEEELVRSQLRGLAAEPRCLSILGDELALPLLALLSHAGATASSDRARDSVLEKAGLSAQGSLRSFDFEVPPDWADHLPTQQHGLFSQFLDQAARRVLLADERGGRGEGERERDERAMRAVFVLDARLDAWIEKSADTPFIWFSHLYGWLKAGALRAPQLVLNKDDSDGLLRDRDLSDGEFLVAGRYSLLLLLREHRECLVLLDEPDTHFNDRWKVDLVYDLAHVLEGTGAQAVVATHSDLTLTDADRSSVFMLDGELTSGHLEPRAPAISPFGADRNEITVQIFGAEGTSGKHAAEVIQRALDSEDDGDVDDALARVGPGVQEFRLRYSQKRRRRDAS
jgi:energy-coupling factor transporter ATP-binding protein EcfA2